MWFGSLWDLKVFCNVRNLTVFSTNTRALWCPSCCWKQISWKYSPKIMLLISKHNTASTDSVLRVNWESVSKPQKTPLVIFFCEVLQDRISVKTKEHMLRCKERNPLCGELGKSWYLFKQVLWFKTQYYLSEVILNKSGLTDRTNSFFCCFLYLYIP